MALEYLPKRNHLQSFASTLCASIKSPPTAHRLFDVINSKCNPQTFSTLNLNSYRTVRQEDRDNYVDISALFPMSGLKHVEIYFTSTIMELTPTQAEAIPAAWPHIEKLVLKAGSEGFVWTTRPRIDHTQLTTILRSCPNLRVLGVRFDATQIGGDQLNQSPTEEEDRDVEWRCGLEEIYVADSPIHSPSPMAAFLTAHVPSLQKLSCLCPFTHDVHKEFLAEYGQRWKDIASEIGIASETE